MSTLPVTTSLGSVRGVALAGVEAFLGIPYAAPPSGALRFELGDPCRSLLAPNEAKRRRWAEAFYTETPR